MPLFFFLSIKNVKLFSHSQVAHIKSLLVSLLKGQSISQTYQRESPHVVTTSTPPDTLTVLSSHPGLTHFPLTFWPPGEGAGGFPVDSNKETLQR